MDLSKFLPTLISAVVAVVSPEVRTLLQDASKNLKSIASKTGNKFDTVLAEIIDAVVPPAS